MTSLHPALTISLIHQPARRVRSWAIAALVVFAIAAVFPAAAQSQAQAPSGKPPQTSAAAAEQPQSPAAPLRVGTKQAPPFVIRKDDGTWSGISIDLMRNLALRLKRDVEIVEFPTPGEVVQAAADSKVDVGIAALSVTVEREKIADFSHPYYQSGLKIAVPRATGSDWMNLMQALTSGPFLTTVGMLAFLLFATGAVMWVIERRHNAEHFPSDPVRGVGAGFWWSAVTMTTVGYGDKAPITFLGRAIAVVWMFAALILTAVFTAQLTSALTLQNIAGPVQKVSDLASARVGILRNSATGDYFTERRQYPIEFPTVEAGLKAVASGGIDAFVHDAPILSYKIGRGLAEDVKLLPDLFEVQNYAAILPQGSALREPLNQALLDITTSDAWPLMQQQYLGAGTDGE